MSCQIEAMQQLAAKLSHDIDTLCCNGVALRQLTPSDRERRLDGDCAKCAGEACNSTYRDGVMRMMWHVVFAEAGGLPQSRAARSRDSAIHAACELLHRSCDVRRIIEPNGSFIERAELNEHYDNGRFPGLRLLELPRTLDTVEP